MREFTLRALLIGLVLTVILGAANAYLGLRAGITIAATYPAAVVGMAVLRAFKGSVLEENITRTAGSIGESVAAGAIFTLPAFLISGAWPSFAPKDAYWKSTALMVTDDVLAFAPRVDTFLLVVSQGQTARRTLANAKEVLSEVNLMGVVLNRSTERNDSPYY